MVDSTTPCRFAAVSPDAWVDVDANMIGTEPRQCRS
jgi:hypothetical protein